MLLYSWLYLGIVAAASSEPHVHGHSMQRLPSSWHAIFEGFLFCNLMRRRWVGQLDGGHPVCQSGRSVMCAANHITLHTMVHSMLLQLVMQQN
jgi:hypothetical protein